MSELKKEMIYIDPIRTAKVSVLIYLCFSVPIVILAFSITFFRYGEMPILPILSGVLLNIFVVFVVFWLICKAYNWGAVRFGGIEFIVKE